MYVPINSDIHITIKLDFLKLEKENRYRRSKEFCI